MNFQPETTIWFCHTGITADNKVECKTEEEVFQAITREGNVWGRMTKASFQRADGFFTIRVDHKDVPYYLLMQCDTVIYKNEEQTAAFWIVGNVIGVEWKNEDCSFVRFVIDPFMTFQPFIDFSNTYAYIEREHVKEDWSSDGGNPLFSNMGPNEDFGTLADTPIFIKTFEYTCNNVLIQSPYDDSGKPSYTGRLKGNLYSSMNNLIKSPEEANQYFKTIADSKDASLNNIVGVYGLPDELRRAIDQGGVMVDDMDDIDAINIAAKQNPNVPIYNNGKCWSSPFCNIRLMSSNGDHVDFNPQWFGSDISSYTMLRKIGCAGGQFGAIAATFKQKNGVFDWKAWADYTVLLDELPRCYWTADGFSDWQSYNTLPILAKIGISSVRAINSLFSNPGPSVGNMIQTLPAQGVTNANSIMNTRAAIGVTDGLANHAETLTNIGATILQQRATGATINGGGSFSNLFDIGQEAWGFKVVYYMAQPYAMQCVDQYFDRFGYRVNKLKKLEIKNRPIWTFIKTAECHVAQQKTGGIPFVYESAINRMFNAGVTIWAHDKYMGGRLIGDFSNAKENRGIKGAL